MMYPASTIVWKIITALQILQFPWRFFIILSFTIIFITGLALSNVQPGHKVKYVLDKIIILIFTTLSVITLHSCYVQSSIPITTEHRNVINKSFITHEGGAGFIPFGVSESIASKISDKTLKNNERLFTCNDGNQPFNYIYKDNKFELSMSSDKPLTLYFNQFHFPSWQCLDTNSGRIIQLRKTEDGMISLSLKKGVYNLVFSHKFTISEIIGMTMSLLSLCCIIFTTVNIQRHRTGRVS